MSALKGEILKAKAGAWSDITEITLSRHRTPLRAILVGQRDLCRPLRLSLQPAISYFAVIVPVSVMVLTAFAASPPIRRANTEAAPRRRRAFLLMEIPPQIAVELGAAWQVQVNNSVPAASRATLQPEFNYLKSLRNHASFQL